MGGSNTQTQQQQSTSSPWAPAQGALQGILGQVGGMTGNAGLNGTESGAIGGLLNSSGYTNQFMPGATSLAHNLLGGGGANNQAGMIGGANQDYQHRLAPYMSASFLNPMNNPGFGDAMRTMGSDISNQVNGMFAGAGRDLSGQNVQALARGLSQGEGGLIANQYNQNVGNQLGAMGSAYGASNQTGGLLSNLNQQGLANQQAGLGTAQQAQGMASAPYMQQLAAEAQARGIPLQYLQGLTGMAGGIGGLGGQSTQTGTQSTQVSPFNQVMGGLSGGLGLLGGFGAFGPQGWGKSLIGGGT